MVAGNDSLHVMCYKTTLAHWSRVNTWRCPFSKLASSVVSLKYLPVLLKIQISTQDVHTLFELLWESWRQIIG